MEEYMRGGVGFLTMINFVHFEYLTHTRAPLPPGREWHTQTHTQTHTMIYSRLRPPLIYYPFNGAENKNRPSSTLPHASKTR